MPLELQSRDREVLDALTNRVRVLSFDQLTRAWWGSGEGAAASARRRLGKLEAEGLLERYPVMAHEPPGFDEVLVRWRPGDGEPDLRRLANRLRRRWPSAPRSSSAIVATKRAAHRFGGHGGRKPRPSEISHDLALGELYLRLRADAPERASRWRSEASLAASGWGGRGQVLPDALIEPDGGGGAGTVVEFCGSYPLEKLERFHEYCFLGSHPYELW